MIKTYDEELACQKIMETGFRAGFHSESITFNENSEFTSCVVSFDGSTKVVSDRELVYNDYGGTELGLLIRYFLSKEPNIRRDKLKEKIIPYWINYNPISDYKYLNKCITRTKNYIYKMKREKGDDFQITLRKINKLRVPKNVVDYFINLPNTQLPKDKLTHVISYVDDMRQKYQTRKDSGEFDKASYEMNPYRVYNFKNIAGINGKKSFYTWDRVKYMWTMYIWMLIQAECGYKSPETIYMKSSIKKFKKEADLPSHFVLYQEENVMREAGIFHYGPDRPKNGWGTEVRILDFIKDIPEAGDEYVELDYYDLYHPGEYIIAQAKGYNCKCPHCGRWFKKNTNNQKYCVNIDCIRERDTTRKKLERSKKNG